MNTYRTGPFFSRLLPATVNRLALLQFNVSLDEEHTFLHVALERGEHIDLGERAHHYFLVTLARQRLKDARCGGDPSGQGWIAVDALAKMLGLDTGHLNIHIYRARRHLASALPSSSDSEAVLERRRGEVRIGALPFRIVRGSLLEGEFVPAPATLPAHSM
ncbi:hypothetical protein [Janthinobacterium sp. PC23-8]|uniref:hypothetical protein n=1 Tax=Janthinobacterium sp. PC23-8 TaxID=2012679 RepID=UPI000B973DB0|nr:hypothetical protein [Janthinobacterium sp. PC23-8]OYO28048.1 hypothetical protein CD932_23435 [Janthinobacterium sp. PC23-8]